MALYQLMTQGQEGVMVSRGGVTKNLKALCNRLKKARKGYIQELCPAPKGNTIIVVRGFSNEASMALQSRGLEVL